jgi:hypothetical protein
MKKPSKPNNPDVEQPLKTSLREKSQILALQKRISSECPPRGHVPPLNQKVSFRSLPLSAATLRGLEQGDGKAENASGAKDKSKKKNVSSQKKQFLIMTDIQNAVIPHALRGRDILGAARTGR